MDAGTRAVVSPAEGMNTKEAEAFLEARETARWG
jgi:hypothetical protein